MATLQSTQAGLYQLVQAAVASQSYSAQVALGWPAQNRLQDIARGRPGVVAIYNRRVGRNVTRWSATPISVALVPSAVATVSSPACLSSGVVGTITLSGNPNPGDAVSAVLSSLTLSYGQRETLAQTIAGAVAIALFGDTAAALASRLSSAVNEESTLSTWVSATASGSEVTLTTLPGIEPLRLASYAGNGGTRVLEIGRRAQEFQIACWAQTVEARDALCDPIQSALAYAEITFGYTLPDGTAIRLINGDDYEIEDATLQDVYRRDFLITLEYPITTVDQLYAILVPGLNAFVESEVPFAPFPPPIPPLPPPALPGFIVDQLGNFIVDQLGNYLSWGLR